MKTCNKCEFDKEAKDFPARGAVCKSCTNDRIAAWRAAKGKARQEAKGERKEYDFSLLLGCWA